MYHLPFGQFLRLKRNSTLQQNYMIQESRMSNQLVNRGKPMKVINWTKQHAQQIQSISFLKEQHPKTTQRVSCGLNFTPLANNIREIIYKHWHIIEHVPGCQDKPFIGMRKTKCLQDFLLSADRLRKQHTISTLPAGHFWYGRCSSCPQVWVRNP